MSLSLSEIEIQFDSRFNQGNRVVARRLTLQSFVIGRFFLSRFFAFFFFIEERKFHQTWVQVFDNPNDVENDRELWLKL